MNRFFRHLQRFPHFLYLLPIFFAFHGYVQNRLSVTFHDVVELTAEYLLASGVLFLLGLIVFRQKAKAAIVAFVLLAFHLFFGAFHDAVKNVATHFFLAKYSILLPLLLIILAAFLLFIKRTKRNFFGATSYLNLLLWVFILIDIPSLLQKTPLQKSPTTLQRCDTCQKPDIYFIIADEYADSVSLAEAFGFNNNGFLQTLRNRGFHVVNNSKSNYNFTPFSVASLFKMDYLQGLEGSNSSRNDINLALGAVNENKLIQFLKASGYTIKNFSIFNLDNQPTAARQNYVKIGKDLITSQTFLGRMRRDLGFHLVTTLKWQWAVDNYTFYVKRCNEKLLNLLKMEVGQKNSSPRFVYTHLLLPHYPYYFDKTGKQRQNNVLQSGDEFNKTAYVDYLNYSNSIYLQLIDSILTTSAQPPIILLMGDHGFREFSSPTQQQKAYYFMNLNAVLLPGKNYERFYDGISGVNQFRALLNTSFRQHLPMLKDSTSFLRE